MSRFGPAVIIRRAELLGLLYSSVKGRVPIRFSESVTAISQDRDGVDVTVRYVARRARWHSEWV